MIMINIIAVCSFLIPFCMMLFIPEETEVVFGEYNIIVMVSNEWQCLLFEKLHFMNYINIIWLFGVIFFFVLNIYEYITFIQKVQKKKFFTYKMICEIIIKKSNKNGTVIKSTYLLAIQKFLSHMCSRNKRTLCYYSSKIN